MDDQTEQSQLSFEPSGDFRWKGISVWLLRGFDVGLGCILFLAPLLMGGRHPVGRLAFVVLICGITVLWAVRQCLIRQATWRFSGAEFILLAGLGLVLFQLVPIGAELVNTISPKTAELLPAWQSDAAASLNLGTWDYISLNPTATRGSLIMYLALAMLFVVVLQRIERRCDIERIMRWMALAAVGMATLGLAQLLAGNGEFLWVYDHPDRSTLRVAKGTFFNQNHFAHFLALGIGPLIWWIHQANKDESTERDGFGNATHDRTRLPRFGLLIGLGLTGLAGVLSFSRGGLIAILLASTVSCGLLWRAGFLGKKSLWTLSAVGSLVLVALTIRGIQPLVNKLERAQSAESVQDLSATRFQLWAGATEAATDYWVAGTGAGTHEDVYRSYMTTYMPNNHPYAENGYLQVWMETGVGGLALLVVGVGYSLWWCLRTQFSGVSRAGTACGAALTAAILCSVIHSLCDFVWYIPACMTVTVIFIACACRLAQLESRREPRIWTLTGFSPLAVTACLGILSFTMVQQRLAPALASPHWDNFERLSLDCNEHRVDLAGSNSEQPLRPDDPKAMKAMLRYLDRALERDPCDPRTNLRKAKVILRLFHHQQMKAENALPLNQIRAAALASNFQAREDLDRWLQRAIGDNRLLLDQALAHTRTAVQNSPLQGAGYMYLAEMAFLMTNETHSQKLLFNQALTVRPHDGSVLLSITGFTMFNEGEEKAREYAKRALCLGFDDKVRVIEFIAPTTSAKDFIDAFEPGEEELRLLFLHLRRRGRHDQLELPGQLLLQKMVPRAQVAAGPESARQWRRISVVCRQIGRHEDAASAARKAVRAAPFDYGARRSLALSLIRIGNSLEAQEHLRWCLGRRAGDDELRQALAAARSRPDTALHRRSPGKNDSRSTFRQ